MPGKMCDRAPYCEDHCGEEAVQLELSKEELKSIKKLLKEMMENPDHFFQMRH